jgi:hypothetical protein
VSRLPATRRLRKLLGSSPTAPSWLRDTSSSFSSDIWAQEGGTSPVSWLMAKSTLCSDCDVQAGSCPLTRH